MKVYINEKKLNLLKETYSPDYVYFKEEILNYDDSRACAFGSYNDNFIISDFREMHLTMLEDYIIDKLRKEGLKYINDSELNDENKDIVFTRGDVLSEVGVLNETRKLEGRLWSREKVLCFWDKISKNDLLYVKRSLEKGLMIDLSDGYIALENEVVTIHDFLNSDIHDTNKERIIHDLSSDKKRKTPQMKAALNTMNKIKGEKLGVPNNHRSVTDAEYNHYKRYGMGEGVEKKKVRQGIIPYESDTFSIGVGESPSIQYGVGENIDLEVDSEDINLSSFKKEKKLNPKIWYGDKLNPKIRLRLLDISDDFWDSLEVSWVKIKDITITGSISNYNWSKYSDIDLHIIVDYKEVNENLEFVKDYFNSKKNEWNESHKNLKMYGFPVEIYVQDINEVHESSGIYSLERNKWLIKPNIHKIKELGLDKYVVKEKSAKIMTMIDDMEESYKSSKDKHIIDEIANKVNLLLIKLKGMRKASLDSDGENGVGNVIWKVLRRTSYLDKLYKLKIDTYDKINTLS